MSDREKGYPFGAYVFDHGYFHDGATWLHNEAQLEAFMNGPFVEAMTRKLEVRITDNGDNMILHAVDGTIVWPTPDAVDELVRETE